MWLSLFNRHCTAIAKLKGLLAGFTDSPISDTKKVCDDWSLGFIVVSEGASLLNDLVSRSKIDPNFEVGVFVTNFFGDILFHWTTQDGSNLTAFLTPSDLMERLPPFPPSYVFSDV